MNSKKNAQNSTEVEKRIKDWKTKYATIHGKSPDQIFLKCASIDYIGGYTNICCYIGLVKDKSDKTYTKNYYKGKPAKGDKPYNTRIVKFPMNRDSIQFDTADAYFAYCLSECGYVTDCDL